MVGYYGYNHSEGIGPRALFQEPNEVYLIPDDSAFEGKLQSLLNDTSMGNMNPVVEDAMMDTFTDYMPVVPTPESYSRFNGHSSSSTSPNSSQEGDSSYPTPYLTPHSHQSVFDQCSSDQSRNGTAPPLDVPFQDFFPRGGCGDGSWNSDPFRTDEVVRQDPGSYFLPPVSFLNRGSSPFEGYNDEGIIGRGWTSDRLNLSPTPRALPSRQPTSNFGNPSQSPSPFRLFYGGGDIFLPSMGNATSQPNAEGEEEIPDQETTMQSSGWTAINDPVVPPQFRPESDVAPSLERETHKIFSSGPLASTPLPATPRKKAAPPKATQAPKPLSTLEEPADQLVQATPVALRAKKVSKKRSKVTVDEEQPDISSIKAAVSIGKRKRGGMPNGLVVQLPYISPDNSSGSEKANNVETRREEVFAVSKPTSKKSRKTAAPTTNEGDDDFPDTQSDTDEDISKPAKKRKAKKKTVASDQTDPEAETGASSRMGSQAVGYTHAEFAAIDEAVSSLRDENNLTQYEINGLIQGNAKDLKANPQTPKDFWQTIRNAVPHKSMQSIQKCARRKYHNFEKRGTFTEEDDEEIRQLHKLYPNQWTKIAQNMDRHHSDVRDRWRNYLAPGAKRNTDIWHGDEEEQFFRIINDLREKARKDHEEKVAAGKAQGEFKPEKFNPVMTQVSKLMDGKRSDLQCRNKWNILKKRRTSMSSADEAKKPQAQKKPIARRVLQAEHSFEFQMRPGDKYECLKAIFNGMDKFKQTLENKIPWDQITRANKDSRWETAERKIVLKHMRIIAGVSPDANAFDAIKAAMKWLEQNHTQQELASHFGGLLPSKRKLKSKTAKPLSNELVSQTDEDSIASPIRTEAPQLKSEYDSDESSAAAGAQTTSRPARKTSGYSSDDQTSKSSSPALPAVSKQDLASLDSIADASSVDSDDD